MRKIVLSLSLVLAVPILACACYWDSDTPSDESIEVNEVLDAITGRFDRFPPWYYEMRLTRVTSLVESEPEQLGAYDDAGVACDRLGRFDEAIGWMARKKTILDRLPDNHYDRDSFTYAKTHRYRYHANLGTFLVHRWLHNGSDRTKIDEVKAARAEIARAIEINPDAHFGREKYQLMALDWIIAPPAMPESGDLPNLLNWEKGKMPADFDPAEAAEAVRGLAGLIRLGNAWESVDVFHALCVAMQYNRLGFEPEFQDLQLPLAYFAYARCQELIDSGKGSLVPNSPKGADLKIRITSVDGIDTGDLQKKFEGLRHESDLDFAERRTFFLSQLKAGKHPDTHPFFMMDAKHVNSPVRESLIHRVRKPRFDGPKLAHELSEGEKAARFGQSVGLSIALASLAGAVVLKTKRAIRQG